MRLYKSATIYIEKDSIEQARTTLEQLQKQAEDVTSVQTSSIAQARQKKMSQDALSIEHRRIRLVEILTFEGDIGVSVFADQLNISRGAVYSDLKALNSAGLVK